MILTVGVNGTGKTTTAGKLAWHLQRELGRSVLLAAADTFRAAATEQLEGWAQRAGCEIVTGAAGSDPGAVAFEAVAQASSRGIDVVIVDTAGRLHTQEDLMAELAKVRRVIARQLDGAPHETLLTVDATTGQNGLRQARLFAEAVEVSGIVLTKLDGTARGGIALAIARELALPVKLIGVGESLEDLRPFDPEDFARRWSPPSSRHAPRRPRRCDNREYGRLVIWLRSLPAGRGGDAHGRVLLAPFAVGALLAAIVSLAGVGSALAVAFFLLASLLVLATLRPLARRHRRLPPPLRTGAAALVGRDAIVLERIANREGVGCVRIDGEVWTARSYDEDDVIDAGERVQVVEIRGATALVMH